MEGFTAHSETEYHKTSIIIADEFMQVMAGKKSDVICQIDFERKRQVEENRSKLIPIIETIILCGRQEMALRGSDESKPVLEPDPNRNDGNFRALLRYRALAGDSVLKKHLKLSDANALYISPTIQNELINICGEIIQTDIVKKLNNAQCFTVLADETTDVAHTEQLSVCVRFIYDDMLNEHFLEFVPVNDVTGRGLANTIIHTLQSRNINLKYLIGQGYDGAAAMGGHLNGVRPAVQEMFPKANVCIISKQCMYIVQLIP